MRQKSKIIQLIKAKDRPYPFPNIPTVLLQTATSKSLKQLNWQDKRSGPPKCSNSYDLCAIFMIQHLQM
ncbi:unnamed protein product (macronuclear) [Paramecium tetraurelia]|uniref:Uncharacterized protein n=1 Tax=Paramecium tetraurelia TaxID=5888 RepID=A0DSL5_PARTE|nr:uncharacterized protein GSPATT00039737001 [Paramecium tetraurelia]CAK86032.1 unnamed protein product [Paramecium tetraurelia]|eukprot:XP_001453429.1 hypothetical protein (macronuclear) [Paramecium tetraurelia strain d4-2]